MNRHARMFFLREDAALQHARALDELAVGDLGAPDFCKELRVLLHSELHSITQVIPRVHSW